MEDIMKIFMGILNVLITTDDRKNKKNYRPKKKFAARSAIRVVRN